MVATVHNPARRQQSFGPGDFLLHGAHMCLRWGSHLLPYEQRMSLGRGAGRALLRLTPRAWRRVDDNLGLIFPDMSLDARKAMFDAVAANIGQSLMELIHMYAYAERIAHLDITGPGLAALDAERGAILVSGHFGQWEGVRIAYRHITGQDCAMLYRPHNNGFYDRHWRDYLTCAGAPAIPKSAVGKAMMAAHLENRGAQLMLIDQHQARGEVMDFLGAPARTAVSAARLALQHDMPLIPAYAIRRANGLDYSVVFEAPVTGDDPVEMTQALNNSLAARVLEHPQQYLWTHRRWRA